MANKYLELGRGGMISEIKKRRDAGSTIKVDFRSATDQELADALLMSDAEAPAAAKPPETATKPPVEAAKPPLAPVLDVDGSEENQVPLQPEIPSLATQPTDEDFAKGWKARNRQDGYTYQVIKQDADTQKPYKARVRAQKSGHQGFFWEGSPEEYAATFEKL